MEELKDKEKEFRVAFFAAHESLTRVIAKRDFDAAADLESSRDQLSASFMEFCTAACERSDRALCGVGEEAPSPRQRKQLAKHRAYAVAMRDSAIR